MSASNVASSKGSSSARPSTKRTSRVAAASTSLRRASASISGLWSSADDRAALAAHELERHGPGPGGDVEHRVAGSGLDARDEEAPPARILAEGEESGRAVVGRPERSEQLARPTGPGGRGVGHPGESMLAPWSWRPSCTGSRRRRCRTRGPARPCPAWCRPSRRRACASTSAPIAAPTERRRGSCSTGRAGRSRERSKVRDAVSISALCELAEEAAGGGDLDDLRARLVALRLTEDPPGIDDAEAAIDGLEAALGSPPQVASPQRLDAVGQATRRLEQALGDTPDSPFVEAMKSASPTIDALTRDVEASYKTTLV